MGTGSVEVLFFLHFVRLPTMSIDDGAYLPPFFWDHLCRHKATQSNYTPPWGNCGTTNTSLDIFNNLIRVISRGGERTC